MDGTINPKKDDDEFRVKSQTVYFELFSQAPNSIKAHTFLEALRNSSLIPYEVITLGLASLPDSGMLSDSCEDVWLKFLEKSHSSSDNIYLQVLMKEGLSLLKRGKVPLALKSEVIESLETETLKKSFPFEKKQEMLSMFFEIFRSDDVQLARDILKTALVTSKLLLLEFYDAPDFETFLIKFLQVEIDPDFVQEYQGFSDIAYFAAIKRNYRKPHIVNFARELQNISAVASSLNVRTISSQALADTLLSGWSGGHL